MQIVLPDASQNHDIHKAEEFKHTNYLHSQSQASQDNSSFGFGVSEETETQTAFSLHLQ